jgi:hypothetical protein
MDTLVLALTGPVTALVFAGAQRIFRAGAQEAAKVAITEQLRGEFAEFKGDLMASIDSAYRRIAECNLIEAGVNNRLDFMNTKINEIQSYAHERGHASDERHERRNES